jgi:hypothetical protein
VRTENRAAGFKTGDKISAASRVRGGLEMQTVLPIRVDGDAWINEQQARGCRERTDSAPPLATP